MTIETITCQCGATMRIETDDPEFLKKAKAEFERNHRGCNLLPAEPGQAS